MKQLPERLKELAPFVVEALPTFKRDKIERVLDLGCGAGRHCIYLAKNGFDVVGVDASLSALRLAKRWGQEENLSVALVRATMTHIPLRDCQFDAVISVSVIHHALKADIIRTIGEVHRILKRNCLLLANITSLSDRRCGTGEKVEPGTFRTLEAFEEKRFEELHHYFTKIEASELLASFAKSKVESMKDRPNYWKITAVK